jgi:NADP-dependent aldehyde dehydrogenase
MNLKLEGLSLVGYRRAKPNGSANPAVNPATGQSFDPGYFWATAQDVSEAAELSSQASVEYGRWRPERRAALLRRIAELFDANTPALVARANLETALPPARLQAEAARTTGQLRLFADLLEAGWWLDARIDHGNPERKPVPKPDVRSLRVPLGPVAVFSSSNFPFAFSVAGGDTASALAAGCPVIVKPHHGHLGTSELVGLILQQAAAQAQAPEGLFSLLYGPGRDTGVALVRHPHIRAVGFTGSRAGGRALMDVAAARPDPIPVYAEMGSINPMFLLPSALQASAETLASGLHASVTLGLGQFCTNPGLVFVRAGSAVQSFQDKLAQLMANTAPGSFLTPSICDAYWKGVGAFSNIPDVKRVAGPAAPPTTAEPQARAVLFSTTAQVFLQERTLMDEVFGPSTVMVECYSREQMLAAARRLEGQLTATIHGTPEDLAAHDDLVALLATKVGRLVWNGFPTGVEVCHAMNHGGPYPATTDGRSTSVGTRAIERFTRPLCYQNFPEAALPEELKEANPQGIWRLVDGQPGRK